MFSDNFQIEPRHCLLPMVLKSSMAVKYGKGTRRHTLILVGGVLVASVTGGVEIRILKY